PDAAGAGPLSLDELPGIDVAAARASTLGNEKLLRRLLAMFLDSQVGAAATFRAARAAGDARQAQRLAHTLGSTAGSLGALGVQRSAQALERACEAGEGDAAIAGLLAALETQLAPVLAGLARLR
ncbi:MAG TPA: Hpt domain-containing protein, partial [Ideonella sp.]|nr:Hpt domain-containing protein [Ideonella sp.]